mmetsp:Transcript_97917/g.304496  ORF Transcript_97917/g.304496 Transcript_97917/m.304496 type:complete len:223 (+) Transcript_97917:122-790(+)
MTPAQLSRGSSSSPASSTSSGSTTAATSAVVSSALFAGTSPPCAPQGSCRSASGGSSFTRAMASSTRASAVRCSCAGPGASAGGVGGWSEERRRPGSGRGGGRPPPPKPAQPRSTASWMSSSRRLSKRPSLPMTRRSPGSTGVVLTMAPWMTVWALASLKPCSRCTCTGLRESYRPGSVLKMGRNRSGCRLQGRSTSSAQSPRHAVTRSEPLSAASSSVVAP